MNATINDVLTAFVTQSTNEVRTARSKANDLARLRTEWRDTNTLVLINYRTEIAYAIRQPESDTFRIYENPKPYSKTTKAKYRDLERLLASRGYRETGRTIPFPATVPGRWNGSGPAWHKTGTDWLDFYEYAKGA